MARRLSDIKYTIYAIRCVPNKKMYIGCTKNVEARIQSHFSQLELQRKDRYNSKSKTRTTSEWQEDYNTYGKGAFEYYILESGIDPSVKAHAEKKWINTYDTCNPQKGYNLRPGPRPNPFQFKEGLPPAFDPHDP